MGHALLQQRLVGRISVPAHGSSSQLLWLNAEWIRVQNRFSQPLPLALLVGLFGGIMWCLTVFSVKVKNAPMLTSYSFTAGRLLIKKQITHANDIYQILYING